MEKRILVTGAGGVIGSAIERYLRNAGYQVVGICRTIKNSADLQRIALDLSKPFEIDGQFDAIIHAAGKVPNRRQEKWCYDQQQFLQYKHCNVDIMENIIDFAIKHSVKRIIYLSSIGVYGDIIDPIINEDSRHINLDAYGMTKYMGEIILQECSQIQGVSLRMPGVICPNTKGVWLTNVIDMLIKNQDITIYTPDFSTKNFVWIDDLCFFIRRLLELPSWKYDTLLLGCKEGATIQQIVNTIIDYTASRSLIHIDNSLRQPFCIDATRAFEMGYQSLTPIEIIKEYLKLSYVQ